MFTIFTTQYREPLIVWFAICLHTIWAIAILVERTSALSTAPYAILVLFGESVPILLFVGVVCAYVGMVTPHRVLSIALMVPQATFLFTSAVGAAKAITIGQFPDGVERARMFIATDQGPAILLAVLYIIAMLQIARSK